MIDDIRTTAQIVAVLRGEGRLHVPCIARMETLEADREHWREAHRLERECHDKTKAEVVRLMGLLREAMEDGIDDYWSTQPSGRKWTREVASVLQQRSGLAQPKGEGRD
jgi:hypothetical protein